MKRLHFLTLYFFSLLASINLLGADAGQGYKWLGLKSKFPHANQLVSKTPRELYKKYDSDLCFCGMPVKIPKLADDMAFVIGILIDGEEELIHTTNQNFADRLFHCSNDELEQKYYFLKTEYLNCAVESRNLPSITPEKLYTNDLKELHTKVLEQNFNYELKDRQIKEVIREINLDLFTFLFLTRITRSKGFEIAVDLQNEKLVLFIKISGGRMVPIDFCENLADSAAIVNKIAEFIKNKWNIDNIFPEDNLLPQLNNFDHLESISRKEYENIAQYYIDHGLVVLGKSIECVPYPALRKFKLYSASN